MDGIWWGGGNGRRGLTSLDHFELDALYVLIKRVRVDWMVLLTFVDGTDAVFWMD